MLLLVLQNSGEPVQGQSTDALYHHLQLTEQEQEEQLQLERQEEVEQEQLQLAMRQAEQLRQEQEKAEQLRLQQEQDLRLQQEAAEKLRVQLEAEKAEALRMQEEQEKKEALRLKQLAQKALSLTTLEILDWKAPAMVAYLLNGVDKDLDPEWVNILQPHRPTTRRVQEAMEEGELTAPQPPQNKTTHVRSEVPTVMVGNSQPNRQRLKSKVESLTINDAQGLDQRGKKEHDHASHKRGRTDKDPRQPTKFSRP